MKQQYNYELFEKILNHINDYPHTFNVRTWKETTECGTTMCIAGLSCYLANLDTPDFRTYSISSMADWYFNTAYKLLKISFDEASILFYSENEEEAISMLEEIVSYKNKEEQRTISHIYNEYQILENM
jgi:hypothetical protein